MGVGLSDEFLETHFTGSNRARRAMNDPVGYVRESVELIKKVLSAILGVDLDGCDGWFDSKKTKYFMNVKGAFGHLTAVIGIPEDHAKGTLHYHFLLFGGLSPYVLQCFARVMKVRDTCEVAIDSMYNVGKRFRETSRRGLVLGVWMKPFNRLRRCCSGRCLLA